MEKIAIVNVNETIYHDKCDNGLDIYMWVNPNVNNFYATLNIKYGAVGTEFKIGNKKTIKVPDGIAHFLEHVKFNETDGTTAHEYFSKLGSSSNAFTTFDFTSYLIMASSHFKENVEHLLDYVFTPVFRKKDIEKEKGIIVEEIGMYKDDPDNQLFYKNLENIFNKDKIKVNILGTKESVNSITVKDLQNVFDTFYHPKNMFMVVTGNFNPEEAVAIIKENQSSKTFPKFKNPEMLFPKEAIPVAKDYEEVTQNIKTPRLVITYKMNRKNFKNIENYSLDFYLYAILKAKYGRTSDFNEELQKNALINGGIEYIIRVKNDTVIITFRVETEYPKELIKKFDKSIKNLDITEDLLRRIRKIAIASNVASYDDIDTVNSIIQNDIIGYDKVVPDVYEIIEALNLTTAKKIIDGITSDNKAVLIAYPKEEKKEDINEEEN